MLPGLPTLGWPYDSVSASAQVLWAAHCLQTSFACRSTPCMVPDAQLSVWLAEVTHRPDYCISVSGAGLKLTFSSELQILERVKGLV